MPLGPRVPARNDGVSLAIFFSAWASSVTSAVSCSGSLENTRCEEAFSRPSRSDIARSTSTMTGMPRRTASAQRSVQNSAQRLSVRMAAQSSSSVSKSGRLHLPQFRIAEGHDGALAGRIDHDRRDRRHQARHVDEMLGLDALMRHLVEDEAARCFPGVAHRPADRGAAAEPHDADRAIERVAAADFVEMRWRSPWSRARERRRMKGQVAHRHADAENARRDFRRFVLKVHPGIRHVGSASRPEPRSGVNRLVHGRFPLCARCRFPHAPSGRSDGARSRTDARQTGRRDAARLCIRATSARSNQRASSSSVRSTTMSSLSRARGASDHQRRRIGPGLRHVIVHVGAADAGFLENLAADRVLDGLGRFDEAGQARIHPGHELLLPAEQASCRLR